MQPYSSRLDRYLKKKLKLALFFNIRTFSFGAKAERSFTCDWRFLNLHGIKIMKTGQHDMIHARDVI